MLVVAAFISFFVVFGMATAGPNPNIINEPLSKIKEFQSSIIGHRQNYDLGMLEISGKTVSFPWASRNAPGLPVHGSRTMPSSHPLKEEIVLNGSRARAYVDDLKAINGVAQRDIIYEQEQNREDESSCLVNSIDIRESGNDQDKKVWPEDSLGHNDIEGLVDNAFNSRDDNSSIDGQPFGFNDLKQLGNRMDIDVSGITVSAINTVQGGSAVATSNILIKPVQVIVFPSEVEEKLK
jgi:hypothetical protein